MLNTLANHGFLPHHGKDISREVTQNALFDALNINKTLGSFLFDFAITTNPTANATTFSLNDLGNHNILEHDASLSRSDAYFGNVLTFNQTVFDETKRYWTGKTINIKMAAKARLARIKTSKATNPTYQMSDLGDAFTYGESAAYVVVFGDKKSGTVKRSWVEWLFEHEQFPQHLGWRRPAELFQSADLDHYMEEMQNITKTLDGPGGPRGKRQASHFGW
ncbi:hypothetical protein NEMBOFW57_010881 [Staphylotrichum longicolle]|uniref:Heme haloperoxidase family profile domain-containing protein n=1 Tax=Staphylotrichum longicolle TaxID=669026 RepID=A0AAD4HV57_9PEZI|nr:hypothetical protein NEMBOFW57_010881 [Staphylotrichum longicolle]